MVIDFVFEELEFESALKQVKKHCFTEQGLKFFDNLKFYTNPDEIEKEQKKLLLFCSVIESGKAVNLGGGKIIPLPDFFSPQFILSPEEIISLYKNYLIAESLYKRFYQYDEFKEYFKDFVLLTEFKNAVKKTFEQDGSFKENATPEFASLYKSFRKAEKSIKQRLNKILEKYKDYVFEPIITTRNDRFVIPINRNFKGRLECLVHDFSSSGATAYVEPIEVVDLNNSLIEVKGKIEEEKGRILRELTKVILENKDTFQIADKVIEYFDSLNARYRFMKQYNLTVPVVKGSGDVFFKQAAHPLLLFSGQKVVKNDVILTPEKRILVVSGSNTGGKTVFLKMAGLLILMSQCIIPVPVEDGSYFTPFSDILTDIGDRQDIAQSLSTFSSHLTRIKLILNRANDSSLVLIDELGTGTEPTDGAAIARAVVLGLIKRKSFAIVTTHHQDVSALAFEFDKVRLASVDFDVETLTPTYRLIYDVPGLSHAIDIAVKLGLPEDFLENAKEYSKKANRDYSQLISVLSEKVKRYEEMLKDIEGRSKKVKEKEERILEREKKLEKLKFELEKEIKRDFENFISDYRKEKEKLLHGIKGELRKKAEQFEDKAIDRFKQDFVKKIEVKEKEKKKKEIKKGYMVKHSFFGIKGIVEEVSGNKLLIVSEGKKMWVSKGDVEVVQEKVKKNSQVKIRTGAKEQMFPLELNLIGKRVDEAIDIIEKELDRAMLEGFEKVRIVHGHGTGRLKSGIRSYLAKLPFVKKIESDSNDAATVVSL
ncbi:DNA mismatch repair protein MutS2 [Thermotomaculum hydrothermale]|uniref:Endonuclease MutS2 n=2 Tax=Thermotomaculum hydrothermale TaxID=981385 RepID=A0A7R6SYG1_9BACT|nr:DNA mismatch repair protein MutS2 [Thermotomaculum hydrothermale]